MFASEKEELMVKTLTPGLYDKCIEDNPCWNPARTGDIYEMMVLHCFKTNMQGKLVESLRNIVNGFNNGLARGSKEFDDLIVF